MFKDVIWSYLPSAIMKSHDDLQSRNWLEILQWESEEVKAYINYQLVTVL